jgi:hypothetical protein
MRNNSKPSLKTLEAAFPGKGKTLRRLLTNAQAVREHPAAIARERECYSRPSLSDLRLHALNAELGTFGVEYAEGRGSSVSFDYLNTGDSYGTTVIRFMDGRYRVGDWGTIVERGNYV